MNLTGHWKGEYTYGRGYSNSLVGKSETFEFDIIDSDGSISGTCIDNVVNAVEGNESRIQGTFSGKSIKFKKRYKFHTGVDENGKHVTLHNPGSDGVDYTGTLRKKLFLKEYYFKGEWSITIRFNGDTVAPEPYICGGTWKMKKVE